MSRCRLVASMITLVVAAAVIPTSASADPLRTRTFRMPSANIGCAFQPAGGGQAAFLRCDIRSGLRPEPRGRCSLDWVGLAMQGRRRAGPLCAGDIAFTPSAPVLRYGRTWTRGPFRCTSRRTGLTCSSRAGHGFRLARAGWRAY